MNVILINYMKIHVGEGCPADPGEEGMLHKRTYCFSLKNVEPIATGLKASGCVTEEESGGTGGDIHVEEGGGEGGPWHRLSSPLTASMGSTSTSYVLNRLLPALSSARLTQVGSSLLFKGRLEKPG